MYRYKEVIIERLIKKTWYKFKKNVLFIIPFIKSIFIHVHTYIYIISFHAFSILNNKNSYLLFSYNKNIPRIFISLNFSSPRKIPSTPSSSNS